LNTSFLSVEVDITRINSFTERSATFLVLWQVTDNLILINVFVVDC